MGEAIGVAVVVDGEVVAASTGWTPVMSYALAHLLGRPFLGLHQVVSAYSHVLPLMMSIAPTIPVGLLLLDRPSLESNQSNQVDRDSNIDDKTVYANR